MATVVADALHDAVLTLVWRHETIEFRTVDDGLQAVVFANSLSAIFEVVGAQGLKPDVKAKLTGEGDVDAELHGGPAVPVGDVCTHGLRGHEHGIAPLDEQALDGVGVVRAPELGEIA